VLAFVPAKPLKPATIYTVTVTRGIEVRGTGQVLESDVRFAFETAKAGAARDSITFKFSSDLVESATADRPTIGLWLFQDSDGNGPEPPPVRSVRVEVHRLRDLDGAIAAYRQIRSAPDWARWAAVDPVPTSDLDKVVAVDAGLRDPEGIPFFQLPDRLAAGWYVVTVRSGTRPTQAILQVTDVAGYLVVSETQTLVWANDVASGKPVVGATVTVGGTDLGRTDSDGLRVEKTPAALLGSGSDPCLDGCFPVVTIRSGDRATFLPSSEGPSAEGYDVWGGWSGGEGARYWHTFDTDRTLYRRTDAVYVWGVVRDRETGTVPDPVTIRLSAVDEDVAIATTESHPNAIGVFSGSLALQDLQEGRYEVTLRAGVDVVSTRWIDIDRILKPAYRLEVTTGRRVYFQGDQVKVTATAAFYEGSPVPGVPLARRSRREDIHHGQTGTAVHRTKVAFDPKSWEVRSGQPDVRSVYVSPARAEEGEISGASREIVVFPSSWTVDAEAQIANGRVRVTEVFMRSTATAWSARSPRAGTSGSSIPPAPRSRARPSPRRSPNPSRTGWRRRRATTSSRRRWCRFTTSRSPSGQPVRSVTTQKDGTFSASIRCPPRTPAMRTRCASPRPTPTSTPHSGSAGHPSPGHPTTTAPSRR
jgi:hypothetical protein